MPPKVSDSAKAKGAWERAERTLRRRIDAARLRLTNGALSTKKKMGIEIKMLKPDYDVYRTSFNDLEDGFPAEEKK